MIRRLLPLLCVLALCMTSGAALAEVVPVQVTAAPTQAPTLAEEQLVSYYKDALFIGDSITRQFQVFLIKKRNNEGYQFKTTFATATSYALSTAPKRTKSSKRAELTYRNRTMPMYEVVERVMPAKVFILLGVNDYAGRDIEKNIGYAEKVIDVIKEVSPDIQVIFISLTPVSRRFCAKHDYRTMWDNYNAALKAMCERRGEGYLDIATPLKDEDGYLKKGYSSDGQFHLSSKGLQIWLDALLAFAQTEYDAGRWTPDGDSAL